jgi:hypothetical protein
MVPIGMTRDETGRTQFFQFILDRSKSETAITHDLANVSRPPLAAEQESEYFGPSYGKQNLQKGLPVFHKLFLNVNASCIQV